jgi:cyclophilin family peptidyl-prolyl cis-trans isomerase
MHSKKFLRTQIASSLLCLAALVPQIGSATIVEVETDLGNFTINLYDNATPLTVANFLDYVQNANYSNSVIHRSISGFIVQGGGVVTDVNAVLTPIDQRPSVTNEPVYSNVRGTIAMAKLGGAPDSATSQWFFNLANNAANLDNSNGGFTVFGEVTAGMDVVDAIAAVQTYNGVSGFNDFPLQNYTAPDAIVNANYVIVTAITVTDTMVDTAAGLNPTPTTAGNGGGGNGGGGGGGGGNFGWLALAGLLAIGRRRYRITKTTQ